MSKDRILGTWSLVSYIILRSENKEKIYPYGKNPIGILIYTLQDVSVHIMRSERIQKNDLTDIKIEAADNYGGYVGSYKIEGNTIIHYPKIASFINYLGIPQVRGFNLQDDLLIIEYSSYEDHEEIHSELIWERVGQ